MIGSPLVTKIFPADPSNRNNLPKIKNRADTTCKITEITVHHVAGNSTIEALGRLWQNPARDGSSHYGVQGRQIGQYVSEDEVAWTNSNWSSNCRAVTIETSNCGGAPTWPVAWDTLDTLVRLVADIARRNNLGRLKFGKNLNLTVHQFYVGTVCPGPFLLNYMHTLEELANKLNEAPPVPPVPPPTGILYRVQVGAFKSSTNAANMQKQCVDRGFKDAYIKKEEGFFKVQIGAFTVKDNADNYLQKAKTAGFLTAYIIASGSSTSAQPIVVNKEIVQGSKVKVKAGAKFTNGVTPIAEVFKTVYNVIEPPSGNRVVIGIGKAVTGAFNRADLILQ